MVWIFLFKRELLLEKESFRVIFAISLALFIAANLLHFTGAGRYSSHGALLSPLVSLGLFQLGRKVFLAYFKREPKDTFFKFEKGAAADRIFNIMFFSLASLLVMITTIIMWELDKLR